MLNALKSKIDKKTVIFSGIIFLIFAALIYLFPYSGDDWAWGSEIGLARLSRFFENYNGRYAGNLLVLALTRSKLLNIIFTAASLVCVCLFPKVYTGSKKFSVLPLALALFLLTPKEIWVQSVVWTAGFSNYIPPILLIVLYLIIVKNIFNEEKPEYSKITPVFTFAIGFVASLFMENITLYGVALSACVILFAFIKYKKFFITHITNFAGSVAGTLFMFSNSAYTSIANAEDSYRSTALSKGLTDTIASHIKTISDQFFLNNMPMLLVVTVLCIVLAFTYLKRCDSKTGKIVTCLSVFLNIITLGIIYAKKQFSYWLIDINSSRAELITNLFIFSIILFYFFSVFAIITVCIEDKDRMFKTLFILLSIPVLIVPLLVVNPIGPRCFFPPYFLGIVLCICMFDYIADSVKPDKLFSLTFNTSLVAASAAMLIFILSIYVPIHKYDVKRNEYALKQVEAGYDVITICKLPYKSYVWTGDPAKAPWDERYKLFHGIDNSVTFELLDYKEFDKWAAEFDKEVSE